MLTTFHLHVTTSSAQHTVWAPSSAKVNIHTYISQNKSVSSSPPHPPLLPPPCTSSPNPVLPSRSPTPPVHPPPSPQAQDAPVVTSPLQRTPTPPVHPPFAPKAQVALVSPPQPQITPTPPVHPLLTLTPKEQKASVEKALSDPTLFPPDLPSIKENIGKSDLMHPRTYAAFHKATPLLYSYAKQGCPVDCGPDWSKETILRLLRRGPHRSSMKKDAVVQLRQETSEKIECGYARVVRWGDIKNDIPPKLKISPVAMIPHKSKKYRCILDLSFTLFEDGVSYPSVNDTTTRLAKAEAMAQLGFCVQRIIARMADNFSIASPFIFCKLDIKDGFWRMRVSNKDAWNFAYVLPSIKDNPTEDDIELVVPNSLQMGWCESPPFFCSGSETARDIIDELVSRPNLPVHRFTDIMMAEFRKSKLPESKGGETFFEVFVDDFVCATNNLTDAHLTQVSKAMIHGVHSIFPPPEVTGHPGGDPVSEKKLDKGEGVWSHKKEILGWDFDGKEFTIQLPPKKCDAIVLQIRKLLKMPRPSLNRYQKLAGKLQHASLGIPCGRALFSPIQYAMKHNPQFVPLTPELKQILEDWRYFIQYMKAHPTSVLQLVSNYPDYVGHSDACGLGAGGVWQGGLKQIARPFLWQLEWPEDIRNSLVTDANPSGTLTINDLELAGLLLNWLALECQPDLHLAFHHVGTFCDNTSAVSWAHKMRTSTSIVAGRLLRMLGLRVHSRQASSLTALHIAGEENVIADIVSRAFKNGKFFEAHSNIVPYFNKNFPLPQSTSWTEFHLPNALVSRVISCLRGELLPMASLRRLPKIVQNTGVTGASMLRCSASIPSSLMKTQPNPSASSPPSQHECEQGVLAEVAKSKFKLARTQSRPSTRPSNWLDNQLPSTKRIKNTNSPSKE